MDDDLFLVFMIFIVIVCDCFVFIFRFVVFGMWGNELKIIKIIFYGKRVFELDL